jgi:hypothetical protein
VDGPARRYGAKAPIAAEIDRLSDLLQQAQLERPRLADEAEARSVTRDELGELLELTRSQLGLDLLDESLDELPYAEKRRALAALAIELTVYCGGRWEMDGRLLCPQPSSLKYL